jgi:hypothetical protein
MSYPPMSAPADLTRFHQLVKQNELRPHVANQLYDVLASCEIVMLCDDSDSMNKAIAEEGTDPFALKRSTRWQELKKLAAIIIDFVTAINPNGLDIYFLNRPAIRNVTNIAGLQSTFNAPPNGGTPLIGALRQIYVDKSIIPTNKNLLIIVITDGEPTDGSREDLYWTLINKQPNVHISFAECTDNAEDMEYLDQWDGRIKNFDNTDDYREELARVKMVQGQQFKFDFTDYVIKILLATFVRWYFNLDQVRVAPNISLPSPVQQFRPALAAPTPVVMTNPVVAPPPPPPLMSPPVAVTTPVMTQAPPPAQTQRSSYQPDLYPRKKPKGCCIIS